MILTTHPAPPAVYDLAVIGGGVNGCGIARDAAGRGLSVYLCEMDDLASATSSWSTKLIHGGLRYLEHYEFRLVREALIEREVLWGIAPHLIRPLRFVLPHQRGMRPAWMLRLGLAFYDHLGGRRRLAGTRRLDLRTDPAGKPLKVGQFATGFEYSDCMVDDARLVVLNALDARLNGADIDTRTRAVAARRSGSVWEIDVETAPTSLNAGAGRRKIEARALVNAAGPWVAAVMRDGLGIAPKAQVRLVQGSHIVVPRLFDHDRAYIFQNADRRIVFAIPWLGDFTLIGTTDRDYSGDPACATATPDEIAYLCGAVGRYFHQQVRPEDVVWSFAGVRPLYDDGASAAAAATRDYVLESDAPDREAAPLVSIFGGKITTYRRLAEAVLDRLAPHMGPEISRRIAERDGWTAKAPLPGGDFPVDGLPALAAALRADHPFLAPETAQRIAAAYGTRARRWLGGARTAADLGRSFGAGLSEAELCFLVEEEWAVTAPDVLWRRSKLGLRLMAAEVAAVDAWLASHTAVRPADRRGPN